jgi:nucleotide-binding universal stress UspA family protein
MNFRSVLVPLDGSELAASALPLAQILALSQGAELTLVTVLPADIEPGWTRGLADYLQEVAAPVRAAGVVVHTTIRLGEPAAAIRELVLECDADLVVMATHGRTGLGRAVLGSVADQVLRSGQVPVLLLHPNHHRSEAALRTVLVPVDGTPGAAVALATAVPLARSSSAKLVLVRAKVPLPLWLYEPTLGLNTGPLIDPMWNEDARLAAEAYAEGMAARLRRAGLAAEGQGISGLPGAAIVAAAEAADADLIVMSTHGRGGPLRAILGSVANEVIRQSHRPVLLVHRTPTSHEVEPEQEAEGQGVATTAAALEPEVPSATDESGFYELLPDSFAEPEAGLLPRHHVSGQSSG